MDADGCDLDHHEIKGPVGSGAEGCPLGAHAQRVDFGGVEPGDALPADAEEDVVEEEEGDGGGGDFFAAAVAGEFVVADQDGDHEVAETLAGCGDPYVRSVRGHRSGSVRLTGCVHHHLSSAPGFYVGDTDQGEEEI